jgi:hypothetical protein
MAEPMWYYAAGDEERGPITAAELKTLAQSGQLAAADLVWREGMEDWAPASDIRGLFSKTAEPPVAPPAGVEPPPPTVPVSRPAGARWADSPPPTEGNSPAPFQAAVVPKAEKSASGSGSVAPKNSVEKRAGGVLPKFKLSAPLLNYVRPAGLALALFGFLLVLASRGCDMLGTRYADRLNAIAQVSEVQFQDDWDRQRTAIEDQQQAIRDKPSQTPAERSRLQTLDEALRNLDKQMGDKQQEYRQGKWQDQKIAARDAGANNRMWAYWRALTFMFGTVVLSSGLLAIATVSQSTERWICLGILAIIFYSVYTGG